MSGFYVIPLYGAPAQWIARHHTVERPVKTALSGYLPETWWRKPPPDTSRNGTGR
jgi:peptide/nickel transport system substrate-binding protein